MEDQKTRIRRALSPEEVAELDEAPIAAQGEEEQPTSTVEKMRKKAEEASAGADVPDLKQDWQQAAIPRDLRIMRGEEVTILRFKADDCKPTARHKGDRTCVLFPLSVADERIARQRMFGDSTRGLEEMAKMMVRAIDGHVVKPSDPSEVENFWEDIGPRHRNMLVGIYQRTHNFDAEERLLFFADCVAVRMAR